MIPNWLSLNNHKTYRMETLKIIIFLVFVLELRNLDLESYTYCSVYVPCSLWNTYFMYVHTCEYIFASLYVQYVLYNLCLAMNLC